MKIVLTFGTFDLLHCGHIRILQRAANLGDTLIVGVSSDKLNFSKKAKYPVYSQSQRLETVSSLKCVDAVFIEESLELKEDYLRKFNTNVLVMGDDWKGKFDHLVDTLENLEIVYLERTPCISTTEVIEKINNRNS